MRITPWRSEEQLNELKFWFYPHKFNLNSDFRQRAIQRVKAYWTRGPYVPHAIDTTSQLTQCKIFDREDVPIDSVKLSYTLALIRFVNGMLDPTQQSQFAVPLHTLAELNGLPSWFVEIRHSGTHEREMPSLQLLRMTCNEALEWLWNNYWDSDEVKQASEDEADRLENQDYREKGWLEENRIKLDSLRELIGSYKANKQLFQEYDYVWNRNLVHATSSFGEDIDIDKEFVKIWVTNFKDLWKSLKTCPQMFIEEIMTSLDKTLIKVALAKLEWIDLELCKWLLISYKDSIKKYKTAPLLKVKLVNSRSLLKLTKQILSGINIKQTLHYWDRWYPMFVQNHSYLHFFMLELLEARIKNALLDKKLRSKIKSQDVEFQIAGLITEMQNQGISKHELHLFDTDNNTSHKRATSENIQDTLQDIAALKSRAKKYKVTPMPWSQHPNWVPRPYGCI